MSGYFSLPRSFTRDPLWLDMPLAYQHVFLVILDHACWQDQLFDDHGMMIQLKPGQLCTTVRDLAKKCGKGITYMIVHRAIEKLGMYRFLRQEVQHIKSVLSITDKRVYDLIVKSYETGCATGLKQDCNRIETQTNTPKKANHKRKEYVPTAIASELAFFLFQKIREFKSDFIEPKMDAWSKHIDAMLNIDGREHEKIRLIINWLPTSEFWRKNVLSTDKLRKQYDKLDLAMAEDKTKSWETQNRKTYSDLSRQDPQAFKHMRIQSKNVVNTENSKDLCFNLHPERFEQLILSVCGLVQHG